MITVVLVQPQTPENIGAIARVMKNFDQEKLALIDPQCDFLSHEALSLATHAKPILRKAKIITKDQLQTFDYVIGTTAKLGKEANVLRSPLTPEQLTKKLSPKNKVALLIGREGDGLYNHELELCDYTVTIPASKKYATLNISHAVAIILYELSKTKKLSVLSHIAPATKKELSIIDQKFHNIIDHLQFHTKEKKQTQQRVWKRIIGKATLTTKEASAALGLLKKIEKSLEKENENQ